MSDDNNNNGNCCICLESLFGDEDAPSIGACVPCGHVFHEPCFDKWRAQQQQQRGGTCKCVMCNQPATQFVKLYLDRSSEPSTDGMVDLDAPDKEDEVNDATYQAWKQKALQFRQKYTAARGNLLKQKEELRRYQTQVQDLQQASDQARGEYELEHLRLAQTQARQARELERVNLENTQYRRQQQTLQRSEAAAHATVSDLQQQLTRVTNGYAEAVRKASAADMTEVQQILSDYPKKQDENRKLHERVGILLREKKELSAYYLRLSSSKTNTAHHKRPLPPPRGMVTGAVAHTTDRDAKTTDRGQALGLRRVLKRKPADDTSVKPNLPLSLLDQKSPTRKPLPKPVLRNPNVLLAQKQQQRVVHKEGRSIFLAAQKKKRKK